MKITLSNPQAEQLKDFRDRLASTRRAFVNEFKELGKFEARKQELETQIAELEAADLSGKKKREALLDARTELEFVNKRLAELDHATVGTSLPAKSRAGSLLREACAALQKALQPVMDDKLAEITAKFRPHFASDSLARGAAWNAMEYGKLCAYCSPRYGSHGMDAPSHMEAAIKLCDEVLSGELKFEFHPNI